MSDNNQNLTAEQVEQQRRQAEQQDANKANSNQNNTITIDGQQVQANPQTGSIPEGIEPAKQNPNLKQTVTSGQKAATTNQVQKVVLQTQYMKVEITDPNILDELNTEGKYASNQIPFKRLEFNLNNMGGRIALVMEDKKEIDREILSGVGRKEVENNADIVKIIRENQEPQPAPAPAQ